MEMTGSSLVASLTIGGLATTGVVDTGATRSIIREDFIGFIPHITHSQTKSYSIRMVDGPSQDSKRSITVEVRIGVMSFNLELLVVRRSVDHFTLGVDFLAKTVAVLTVPGNSVNTPTATAAAKVTRASAVPESSPTPDPMAISPSKQTQTNALGRTTEVRTVRTMPLTTGNIAAKAATTRSDFPRPKYVTQERVRHATAKPARAFEELQSFTTGGGTIITITASRKTNKNEKDKKSKAGKDNDNSPTHNSNNSGLCLHHCPRQGQFNKLASPSPNNFYGTSTNMEQWTDASKQTHVLHNQPDKWLPLHEGDPIPNRLQHRSTEIVSSMCSLDTSHHPQQTNDQQHVQPRHFTTPTADNSSAACAASTRHIPKSR
uniref:Peptidase A2 domain-containing protein n=1 Tax=Glossina palpalis gambiensis TaxID=67801 RepID=A0A1B0ALK6_9MUSC